MSHTPGPWEINRQDGSNPPREVFADDSLVADTGCGPLLHGTAEAYANTLLIAAAPDLLAACKLLDVTIQEWRETGNINYKHWNNASEKLQAAIQKAEQS